MKVLLADDHEIVRTGLKRILEFNRQVTEILEANNGQKAFEIICEEKPDVVILDISMPKLTGLDVLKKIKNLNIKTRILILSMYPEKEYAIRALRNGAFGYITKNRVAEELDTAINFVLKEKKYVSKDLHEIFFDLSTEDMELKPHEKLSEREYEVFLLLASGKNFNEIANALFISNKTVSSYKSRIFEKMDILNITELVKYALQNKLIK